MSARLAPSIAKLLALPEGERRLGVFVLVRQLGKGGFAPVWLAKEIYGGTELRTVALKLFAVDDTHPTDLGGLTTTGATARQMRREQIVAEARALCQVEHPNIVRFFAIAADETTDVVGLAMEYVHGIPLDQRLSDVRTLPLHETLAMGCAVASALAAAHQAGLVHRDIKPANVVDAAGVFKLIDFGIAAVGERIAPRRARGKARTSAPTTTPSTPTPANVVMDDLPLETGPSPTRSGSRLLGTASFGVSGTVGYMDPACMREDKPATPASDLYSFGAMLFECMTGQLPAVAAARRAGATGLAPEVLDGRSAPPPLVEMLPDAPPALARLVDALLDPEPAKRPRSSEVVAWELERIRRELAGRARPLPPEERGPFRGLGRFEEADRDVYFGRSAEVAAGLEMVRTRGLVTLVGASGSGKSSLARAGLLPAIVDGELGGWPREWESVVVVPGADPHAAIVEALRSWLFAEGELETALDATSVLARLADAVAENGTGLVILVDQLEELVTVATGESQTWAVDLLARFAAQIVPGLRCIATARRDLLDSLLAVKELGRALTRGALLVAPLSDAAWEEVLDHALETYGYRLEDADMRATLLAQLKGTSSAMPLVQFALTRLWERRDTARKIIPRAALEAIGGIGGALEAHADATLARIEKLGPDAATAARDVLLALTTASGTRATRSRTDLLRRVRSPLTERIVEELVEARLLVSEVEGLTIAHETLLARWENLRLWIQEAREDRTRAEEIEREARAWAAEGWPPERLLKKRRLRAATELAQKDAALIGEESHAFLRASRAMERRGWMMMASPIAIVALAVAAWGVMRWDAHREKVSYCGATTERWRAPVCIGILDARAVGRRDTSKRFVTQGGRVVRVERVNAAGILIDDDEGAAAWQYQYGEGGKVREIVTYDRLGQVQLRELYSEDLKQVRREDAFGRPKPIAAGHTETTRLASSATTIHYDYDGRGFAVRERYFGTYGTPRFDDLGAYGYAYQYDRRGLWTKADVLGPDGQPKPSTEGIAHARHSYDAMGNETEASWFDLEDKPAILGTHAPTRRHTYDAAGNVLEEANFDAAGKPVITKWGYARAVYTYDEHGHRTQLAYFDGANAPVILPDGYAAFRSEFDARGNEVRVTWLGVRGEPIVAEYGHAAQRRRFDENDQMIELAFFDAEDKPTLHVDGEAVMRRRFDAHGNVLQIANTGTDGAPVLVSGYARVTYRYDDHDNLVETAYFGVDGEPTIAKAGYARLTTAYDERGQKIESTYYGPDGAEMVQNGFAKVRYKWDQKGNPIESAYFGTNGKPVLAFGQYAVLLSTFDEGGRKVAESYLGVDGKPIWRGGAAGEEYAFDARGNKIKTAYLGPDGTPALIGGRYSRIASTFDDRGRETERTYYGIDDAPIHTDELIHGWTAEYDDRGNQTALAYFDVKKKPTLHKNGTAGWRAKYDGRYEIEREYVGLDGQPIKTSDGTARTTARFDALGRELERAYWDVEGNLALFSGGFARATTSYDEAGRPVERAWFGVDGKPTLRDGAARTTTARDARGDVVEVKNYGVDGAPVAANEGWARVARSFDRLGKTTEEAYFDKDGAPTLDKTGAARWTAAYDPDGQQVERAYFGKDGAPIAPRSIGWARLTSRWDESGNETEHAYFGADGKPVKKDGAARWTATYAHGHATETRFFDEGGAPAANDEGFARTTSRYDVYGHVLELAGFGADDEPAKHKEGWASYKSTFDELGREVARSFFGEGGRPVLTTQGIHRWTARYDDRGGQTEKRWLSLDDKPVMVDGYARSRTRFDDRGKVLEQAWYGADTAPIAKNGFARSEQTYDRASNETSIAYFGADGKPTLVGGWAKRTQDFDTRSLLRAQAFFGADGRPVFGKDGYASRTIVRDERGEVLEQRFFGDDGKLTTRDMGVAVVLTKLDDYGHIVERDYLGADEKPALNDEGVAGSTSTYDARGHENARCVFGLERKAVAIRVHHWTCWRAAYDAYDTRLELRYEGPDGQPVASDEGFARLVAKHDTRGNLIEERYFAPDGKPAAHKSGQSIWRAEYNLYNKVVKASYLDADEKPTPNKDGYATYELAYDAQHRLAEARYFGTDGQPKENVKGCTRVSYAYDAAGKSTTTCFDRDGKERK